MSMWSQFHHSFLSFFVFALLQFCRPDCLRAWNCRLTATGAKNLFVILGLIPLRPGLWPLCMITSDKQISPPSLICKENSLHLHSLCVDILFQFTTSGILLCKTSQLYNFKTRLGGEICSFDVNTHKGYFVLRTPPIVICTCTAVCILTWSTLSYADSMWSILNCSSAIISSFSFLMSSLSFLVFLSSSSVEAGFYF